MSEKWEVFNKTHGHTRRGTISIRKGGTMSLSGDVFDGLGSPANIVFMFNKSEWKVGIKASDDERHSYPLRRATRSKMRIVSGAAFLRYHGLENLEKRPYKVEFVGKMATFYVGGES